MGTLAKRTKMHYGWIVVLVTFFTLIVSAGIRSVPSIFMLPFEKEFGWGRADVSSVVSINIFLYGLMGPFSAALMERFGTRRVVLISLICIASSLSLTPMITALWQFDLLWGVVVGLGTGSLANVLGVTIANRWFSKNKGVVVGILTASAATGQLLFLPLLAKITVDVGWRYAIYTAIAVIAVLIPVVAIWMRNHPYDIGAAPYGSDQVVKPAEFKGNLFMTPLLTLRDASKNKAFWLLAGTFFFCGFSTNGLIGTHLIPACGDFGIPEVTAAGLLALMGIFDLVGTTMSGWLTDRFDGRWLLFWYYGLRGISLIFLPQALGLGYTELLVFAVFYGLDWIATVPPTVKIASDIFGKEKAGMVFGWIVVAHQLGASFAAYEAGLLRDLLGSYSLPFLMAGFVCMIAAIMAVRIRRSGTAVRAL
ncbi:MULTISPECIES: MFS transporter [unclassified Paenibacillus]|uniref:MFS transporter n=1 Tax=unclassified Paenibacillus TaxID=185978 RepID=UPI00070E2728|nr:MULTISPECIES: MFS transporter [unclassified Paenibacillus]KQX45208.1 MFS transporter [Paenibacillus sp. Root444D2]KRE45555.1 MFS transporter [Paenibacillus sp. Soil724D2]